MSGTNLWDHALAARQKRLSKKTFSRNDAGQRLPNNHQETDSDESDSETGGSEGASSVNSRDEEYLRLSTQVTQMRMQLTEFGSLDGLCNALKRTLTESADIARAWYVHDVNLQNCEPPHVN